MVLAYIPVPLNSMTEIRKHLNVGEVRVKEWVDAGAPIAVEGDGANARYSSELAALLTWRAEYSKFMRLQKRAQNA